MKDYIDKLAEIEAKGLTLGTGEEKLAVFRGMKSEELVACSILLQGIYLLIEKNACASGEDKQKVVLVKGNLKLINEVIADNFTNKKE